MSATSYCKERGIKVSEVCRLTGLHRSTVERWYESRPLLFNVIVLGCLEVRRGSL